MKKILFLYLLLLLALNFQGQQLSQFSYFTYNYMQYNPAVVGTAPCLDLKFGVRRQWKGFEGAPITGFANIHGKIGKQTKYRYMGLGALVETDDAGPFAYTSIQLAYSYHQKLANKYYLAAGLSLGFSQYSIDYGEMSLEDQVNETAISGAINDFVFPTMSAGLWLYRNNRFYGISVRNINAPKIEGLADSRLNRHYTLANGYAIRVSDELTFKPAFLLNYAGKSRSSLEAQCVLDFKDMVGVGIGARSGHGFSALLKVSAMKYVTFAYAYDVTLNKIRYQGANTHEIIIGIRACRTYDPLHVSCSAYD